MATPAQAMISEKRRRAAALQARLPVQLQIPDLRPARPVRTPAATSPPAVRASLAPVSVPAAASTSGSPTPPADVPPQASRRYDAGHRQVTQLIDQMRDKRRRLLGRLWNVSLALTALSLIALVSELVQSWNAPESGADAQDVAAEAAPAAPVSKPAPRRAARIVPVRAQVLANELPTTGEDEEPVQQAIYTTRQAERPKGVWLDGTIHADDSDTKQP